MWFDESRLCIEAFEADIEPLSLNEMTLFLGLVGADVEKGEGKKLTFLFDKDDKASYGLE